MQGNINPVKQSMLHEFLDTLSPEQGELLELAIKDKTQYDSFFEELSIHKSIQPPVQKVAHTIIVPLTIVDDKKAVVEETEAAEDEFTTWKNKVYAFVSVITITGICVASVFFFSSMHRKQTFAKQKPPTVQTATVSSNND
ncbi:hypothetical protein LX64_02470 [Chitinophaga skermanii]|uniref:Uncharacterized protein n=1 Tax=Chitinophaga skermanii TaxID=331697 RepID=A0A327QPN5_9BACT|nr:hypothetical protein [Chitinophaga skermanii]RAJ05313.1 hypothetical protein LX64_02470 [Chitinophaga skermanii]